MKSIKFSLVAASVLALTGCPAWASSSVENSAADAGATLTAKRSSGQILLTQGDIKRRYQLIDNISVSVPKTVFNLHPTHQMVNVKLREEAAEMGADAVIFVHYRDVGVRAFSWASLEGSGRAVRFVK